MRDRVISFMPSLVLLALLAATSLFAQSNATPSAESASRLDQLDQIYQQQLRTRHIPLLSKYLTDLQRESARAADPGPYQQEISRVQAIISSGGVIDLPAASRELSSPTPGQPPAAMPEKPSLSQKIENSVLSLTPSLARSIQPVPAGSASPLAASIGRLAWKIDALPAGSYELVLHYASVDSTTPVPVVVEFAGQKIEALIDKERATKNTRTYRLMRLGRMTLDQAAAGDELVLTAGSAEASSLLVRHLHITPVSKP